MGPNHTTELSIGKLLLLLRLTRLKTRAVCSATTINPANATSASGSWPYRPLPTSEMKASRMHSVQILPFYIAHFHVEVSGDEDKSGA